jgi:uncharacterized membrane protein
MFPGLQNEAFQNEGFQDEESHHEAFHGRESRDEAAQDRCAGMKHLGMKNVELNQVISGHPVLERLLASVLQYGTWLASAAIGLGLAVALVDSHSGLHNVGFLSSTRIISLGILLFILLPVFRVFLMLLVFVKERDHRFSVIAGLVLLILVLGFVVGMRVSAGAG